MIDPLIARLLSVTLGLLLAAATAHKVISFDRFTSVVRDYRLVPAILVRPAAGFVVAVEALLAIGWLARIATPQVALLTATMFAVYGAAIAINLLRGRVHISCGCGLGSAAQGEQLLSWTLVLRNGLLASLALLPGLPAAERNLHTLDWVTLAAAVLASALLYLAATQLARNGWAIRSWRIDD